MNVELDKSLKEFGICMLVVSPIFIIGYFLVAKAGIAGIILGFPLFLFGSCIIAFPMADVFSVSYSSLLWSHQEQGPQPLYGIAESYVKQDLYELALLEYEQVVKEFPDEVKPFIDMIDIAVVRMNDPVLAKEIYEKGISALKDKEKHKELKRMYEAILTRIENPPT
jgi:tetratricopeptide (TPR) repeat protein